MKLAKLSQMIYYPSFHLLILALQTNVQCGGWLGGPIDRRTDTMMDRQTQPHTLLLKRLTTDLSSHRDARTCLKTGFSPIVISQLGASHSKEFDFLLVSLTQYGVKKNMKMTVFLFLRFLYLPFLFLPLSFFRFPRIQQNPVLSCYKRNNC